MTATDARPLADDTPTCAGAGLDPGPAAPPEEAAGQMLTRLGTDAQAWAWEFVRRFAGETVGETKVDVGLMIGWFANAIEIGRSAGQSAPVGLPVGELSAGEVTARMLAAEDALGNALRNRPAVPPDARGYAARAAAVLEEAVNAPTPNDALALVAVADAYRDLAIALATHGGLSPREDDQ